MRLIIFISLYILLKPNSSIEQLIFVIFPDPHHSRTFTPRSLCCTPPHLYMLDDVRNAAGNRKRGSLTLSRQATSSNKTDTTLDNPQISTGFGKRVNLPIFMQGNPHLMNKELSIGQKQYLWGIARVYSLSQMKSQVL